MKDQLQLQEIAGYLPYGIMIDISNYKCDYVGIKRAKANGFYFIGDELHITYDGGHTGKDIGVFKPILRPMSDLRKDEYSELCISLGLYTGADIDFVIGSPKQLQYQDVIKLLEHHFDVHNLIGQGKAISINDLPPIKD